MEVHGGAEIHLQPKEKMHTAAVCEELQSVRRSHIGEFCGGLSSTGWDPYWSRGIVRGTSPEEKGEAETMCGEMTTDPIL